MQQLIRYLIWFLLLFAGYNSQAQNNTVYGAGISYTNGVPSWAPNPRTSRAAVDTVTGRWYHFNTPGGWQWIGNTVEEIAGCAAPAYTPSKGDSRLVVNNCVKPQVYWYDGTVWKWINQGEVYTAGQGIRIESNTIILDSLNFLDFRTGNALDGDVGRVQWNDTDGTLDLNLKGGNVTLQIGQEEVTLVKHADNSGLIEGRVVYVVGSDGANKTVRYAKADSDATSATTFGLMTESASGGGKAFCTTFGLVRNLNTTNLTEGGIVWLSADTAGTMTAVRPTAPDHGVMIGFCIRKHATQGAIFVQVQNGYELNELHDVFVPSPTNGQVLTWNSTNARWEAITPANQLQTLSTNGSAGNISISSGNTITLNVNDADASATNELQTLSTGTNTLTLSNGGGTVTVDTDPTNDVTGSGTLDRVPFWTGAQTLGRSFNFRYSTDGAVEGGLILRPKQFGNFGVPLFIYNNINSTGQRLLVVRDSVTGTDVFVIGPDRTTIRNELIYQQEYLSWGSSGSTPIVRLRTTGGRIQFHDVNYTTRFTTNPTSGTTMIGSNAVPNAMLEVRGSGTSSSTWTAQFHNSAGNNNALMIRDDGNVGIGTNAPADRLHVAGAIRSSVSGAFANFTAYNPAGGYPRAQFIIGNSASDVNTGLIMSPNKDAIPISLNIANYTDALNANLKAWSINVSANSNILASYAGTGETASPQGNPIYIATRFNNATTVPAIFINNTNNQQVAINTPTPDASAQFEVSSTNRGVLFPRMTTTQRNAIATPADGLVIYNTTDNKLQVRAAGAWVDLH